MWFEISESAIFGVFDDPNRPENLRVNLDTLLPIAAADRDQLLAASQAFLSTKKYQTQLGLARGGLVKFGQYVRDKDICIIPNSNDVDGWQFQILDWFSWYLVHSHERRLYKSRVKGWDTVAVPWLKGLVDEVYLPDGLFFPRAKNRNQRGKPRSPRRPEIVGDKSASTTSRPIDKTIAGPLFWRSDSEYLDEVETLLRKRDRALRRAVDDYWLRLVKDFREGKRLIRLVPDDEFEERRSRNDWTVHRRFSRMAKKNARVTIPCVPRSESWALRVLQSELRETSNDQVFSASSIAMHPAFSPLFMKDRSWTPIEPLLTKTALTPEQASALESRSMFMRFLGILTTLDAAVATVILLQEHPNLTPQGILNARLFSHSGKSYMIAAGDGRQTIFSIDKPRAGNRKYALLTHRAARVVKHVVRATADVRAALRRAEYSHWRNLFLGCPAGRNSRIGILRSVTARAIASPKNQRNTLGCFYPELEAAGIVPGVVNFRKIRATQAVLNWFDTGSVSAASQSLGNSYAIAVQHYVPAPLIRLWNDRLIRRFQNTLITLAASDEEYLLEVSDIESLGDLQSFLVQLLHENPPGSSPIGDELHKRIDHSEVPGLSSQSATPSFSLLSIRLCSNSLAMLYAYKDIALRMLPQQQLETADSRTGLAPASFINLATMVQVASSSANLSDVMRESLDITRLRAVDRSARKKLPTVLRKFRDLRLDSVWSN